MAEFRKVNDRNLVLFGIPDVDAEQEFGRVYAELERRPVVEDVSKPQTAPLASPVISLVDINGLLTNPPIVYNLAPYDFAGSIANLTFGVDTNNNLGSGINSLWFCTVPPGLVPEYPVVGPVDEFVNYRFEQLIVSYNTSAFTYTGNPFPPPGEPLRSNSLSLSVFPQTDTSGVLRWDQAMHILNNKIFFVNKYYGYGSVWKRMYYLDLAQLDYGTTPQVLYGNTRHDMPTTAPIPVADDIGHIHKVSISGTEYLINEVGRVYNPATDSWSGPISGPTGPLSHRQFAANGAYMWARENLNLYSAAASLTPSWNLVHTLPSSAVFTDLPRFDFGYGVNTCVSPSSGELFWFQPVQVGSSSPAVYTHTLNSFNFTTGARTTRPNVFNSPIGLPFGSIPDTSPSALMPKPDSFTGITESTVVAGTNFLAILSAVRTDTVGSAVQRTSANPASIASTSAVWVIKGSGATLDAQATLITTGDTTLLSAAISPPPYANWFITIPRGGIAASGDRLFTWIGSTLDTLGSGENLYIILESRVREWEIT